MINSSNDSDIRVQERNSGLAKLAKCIAEVGPQINLIARTTQQYKESVRYRYHKFVVDRGLTIQASPNYSKLGFRRLIILAKFANDFEVQAPVILSAMSEFCYLHSFTRTILSHEYIIHVAVPGELSDRCASLFRKLGEMGLFTGLKILEFQEMRNPPMKAEYYDFTTGNWSFAWPEVQSKTPALASAARQEVEKYDKLDLLILKELEIDANRTLVKISDNVKVNSKTLEFHFISHVQARGLIKSYKIGWPGSRYDFKLEKALSKRHRYIEVAILLEHGTRTENAELMSLLNNTPFLWSEAVEPNYCAEVYIPVNTYIEFLEYIGDFAARVGDKLKVFEMDQTRALRFTIGHKLFDSESKTWQLDSEDIVRKFENLKLSIKSGAI